MDSAKIKINKYVEVYKDVFKGEFRDFIKGLKPKVDDLQKENKFAKVEGSEIVERQLGEMPETLFLMLTKNLGPEEYAWWQSQAGQKWFFNNHQDFKVTFGRV